MDSSNSQVAVWFSSIKQTIADEFESLDLSNVQRIGNG
jgi:hypothetical protein